jgi:hypothetical protein
VSEAAGVGVSACAKQPRSSTASPGGTKTTKETKLTPTASRYFRGKHGNNAKNKQNMAELHRNLGSLMIRR